VAIRRRRTADFSPTSSGDLPTLGPVLLHADLSWREQKGLCIDPMHLGADRFHATAGEVDQPLGLTIVGLGGVEHNGTVSAHAEDDRLGIAQLVRVEDQQLLPSGSHGDIHGSTLREIRRIAQSLADFLPLLIACLPQAPATRKTLVLQCFSVMGVARIELA